MQVPLLLSLGEGERGLTKALASGDADLVHLALFHLHRALPLADFQAVLAARPAARRLFEKYCRSQVCHRLKGRLVLTMLVGMIFECRRQCLHSATRTLIR